MLKTLVVLVLAACGVLAVNAGPTDPEPRDEPWWWERHALHVSHTASNPGIPIVFYGDSITEGWGGMGWGGNEVWQQFYDPLGAANYGIGADRTEHVLYRILNGEIDGLNPKLVVLKIGTNNLGSAPNAEIAAGIAAIVRTLRERLPNTKVLVLGIMPRGDGDSAWLYEQIIEINAMTRELHNGSTVFFLDMFGSFSQSWGVVPESLFSDRLHLTIAGYAKWAEVMNPLFNALCV